MFRALRDIRGRREASSQAAGWKRTSASRTKTCSGQRACWTKGLLAASEGWEEVGGPGINDYGKPP